MSKLLTIVGAHVAGLAAGAIMMTSAMAATTLKIQLAVPLSADEAVMVNSFASDVEALTEGEVKLELLPAGAVVGVGDIIDAVDSGLVDGGFAWTHYWSGKHPAAMLFGSPVAGAGVGIDNIAFMSWFQYGGGKELYDRLWDARAVHVKGFMLQPVGPEALGWFKEPIHSMDDFRKYRFRTPPAFRVSPTRISALRQSPWVAVTFCRLWKRAPSTLLNGAVQSLIPSSASRRS